MIDPLPPTLEEEWAVYNRYPQSLILDGGDTAREAYEDIENACEAFENPLDDTLSAFFECSCIDECGLEFFDFATQTLEYTRTDLVNEGGDAKLLELELSALVSHQYTLVEAMIDECRHLGLFDNPTRTNYYEFDRVLSPGVLVLTKRAFSAIVENRS